MHKKRDSAFAVSGNEGGEAGVVYLRIARSRAIDSASVVMRISPASRVRSDLPSADRTGNDRRETLGRKRSNLVDNRPPRDDSMRDNRASDDEAKRAVRNAEDAVRRAEQDAAVSALRAERDAAAAAARSARDQESDAVSDQFHHWRPNRLPRP